MADILSQEEIDALLEVVDDDADETEETIEKPTISHQRQITLYDFKRPNRVSKEQLRAFREFTTKWQEHSLAKFLQLCAPSLKSSSIVWIK